MVEQTSHWLSTRKQEHFNSNDLKRAVECLEDDGKNWVEGRDQVKSYFRV